MSFLEYLKWRRSEKGFLPADTVHHPPDINPILNAAMEAPSCYGLQPYKIIVITSDTVKRALSTVTYNQPQISQCTHLLVFCARTDLEDRIADYARRTGIREEMVNTLNEIVASLSHPTHWAKHQAYLALGFALAAATEKKISTCPIMEFSPDGIAATLNLHHSLVPAALLAIGIHNPALPTASRFRFPTSDLVHYFNESEPVDVQVPKTKYRHTTPIRRRPEKND